MRLRLTALSLLSLALSAPAALSQTTMDATPAPAPAYSDQQPIAASADQEFCITVMSGFPDDGQLARYQFFRLTEEMAKGASPEFMRAVSAFGDGSVSASTPILDVIEEIANPVLRQAAPELTVTNMKHLIDFAQRCDSYLSGQIDSLLAFDSTLSDSDLIIGEDALFLRQVLSDSLFRLGAPTDPEHSFAVTQYAGSLVTMRDNIEFAAYESEVDELETIFMTDLDGRLARSNDLINSEMDREIVSDSTALSDDLNDDAERKRKMSALETLAKILNGY
jgi:hypothetical protein